jgi:DNA polymerase-3 subunit beta
MNAMPDTTEHGAPAPTARIAERALCELLDRALVAARRDTDADPARYPVLIEARPHALRMVATDGYRLALVEREWERPKFPAQLYVAPSHLIALRERLRPRAKAPVTLTVKRAGLAVESDAACIILPLTAEATFPDYQFVLLSPSSTVLHVPRRDFLPALRCVAASADKDFPGFRPVRLDLEPGRLTVSVAKPSSPAVPTATLSISYDGKPLSFGFNARFLIEALHLYDARETIALGLTDPHTPAIIRGLRDPRFTYAVMPMLL